MVTCYIIQSVIWTFRHGRHRDGEIGRLRPTSIRTDGVDDAVVNYVEERPWRPIQSSNSGVVMFGTAILVGSAM